MRDLADMELECQPRALGQISITADRKRNATVLCDLYQQGCLKALFPQRESHIETVLVNTAGGITGGDHLQFNATAEKEAHLVLTTQACERVYRAQGQSTGKVTTTLTVQDGAMLAWLPQETIFYDHGRLQRRLTVNLSKSARALIVEPVLFGRLAMGETQLNGMFQDQIEILMDGDLSYCDKTLLAGDITAKLERPAVANGMHAMATLIYRAPAASGVAEQIKRLLNPTSGGSLLENDLLVLRLMARNGQDLRRMMLPILDLLTQNTLPKCWRL